MLTSYSDASFVSAEYGKEHRRLRVVKLRGVNPRGGYHEFVIRTGGATTADAGPAGSGLPAAPHARYAVDAPGAGLSAHRPAG